MLSRINEKPEINYVIIKLSTKQLRAFSHIT